MTTTATNTGSAFTHLRVVLVGRSPIESAVRKREDIELLRARTATDALGEIAAAQDENDEISALLMGDGAVDAAEAADFYGAVRAIDPDLRILEIGEHDAESILEQLDHDQPSTTAPAPAAKPQPGGFAFENEDVIAPRRTASEPAPAAPYITPADAVLAGADPTTAFIETARRRTNDPSLEFVPAKSAEKAPATAQAPVSRRGVTFGFVCASGAARRELDSLAHELAGWLALLEQQRQLRAAAFTDQLTGAWNRRYFDYFFPRAIESARALRHDVTLMVYDIDDFKTYNDRYGHAAGDEILRETVRLLISVIRPTDRVCRIGGDEFAVIFDDPTGPRQGAGHHPTLIADIASRFQRQICDHRFPKLGEEAPGTLTISGGMATFPWDGACAESLLEKADQLALQSKRQGKNLITFGPGAARVCGARPGSHGPHGGT